MGQFDALINAANKAMDNADVLLASSDTPFNAVYKQYKTLQSLWFRMIEEASDSNNRRLEDTCVDLEEYVARCEDWIKKNSPNNKSAQQPNEGENQTTDK